jgi:hypothetical protein
MKRGARSIDELRDFFLAEYGWQSVGPFRIGSLSDAPGFLQRLDIEEAQSRHTLRYCDGRFPFLRQFGLIFANVSRA